MRACSVSHVRLFETPWTVARELLCPWDFPSKNTGVHCHLFLPGVFPYPEIEIQYSLLYWQVGSLSLSHWGSPLIHTRYNLNLVITYCFVSLNEKIS